MSTQSKRGTGRGQSRALYRGHRHKSTWRGAARRLPFRKSPSRGSVSTIISPSPQGRKARPNETESSAISWTPTHSNVQEPSPMSSNGRAAVDGFPLTSARDESFYLGAPSVQASSRHLASGPSTPQPQPSHSLTPQTLPSSLFRRHAPKAFVRTDNSGRLTLVPASTESAATERAYAPTSFISWSATVPRAASVAPVDEIVTEPEVERTVQRPKQVMAIASDRQYLACAYVEPSTSTLFVMDDVFVPDDAARSAVVKQIRDEAQADVILVSSAEEDKLIQELRKPIIATGTESTYVEIRPRNEFGHTMAKSQLLMLQVDCSLHNRVSTNGDDTGRENIDAETVRKEQRLYEINTWVDPQACQALGCVGALIHYLSTSLLQDPDSFKLSSIEKMIMSKVMYMTEDAMKSLSIFAGESHPNVHMRSGEKNKSKEGLSLLGILDICHTPHGHALLRRWLRQPSQEMAVLSKRHSTIRCLLAPENKTIVDALHAAMKGVKHVSHIMDKMRRGTIDTGGWLSCLQTLFSMVKLSTFCGQLREAEKIEVIQRLINVDSQGLNTLGQMINGIVDFDQSTNSGRVTVKRQVDDNLDSLRHDFAGLDSFLSLVAERITEDLSGTLCIPLGVVYFPQIGYLISLPLPPSRDENEYENLPAWTFLFKSEDQAYFRSAETRELDETIGDIYGMITDLEVEIVHRLNLEVLKLDKILLQVSELCAELDVLLAFAEVSRKHDYTEPVMTKDNVIEVEEGWHPLQELCVDAFVSNDVHVIGGIGLEADAPRTDRSEHPGSQDQNQNTVIPRSVIVMTGANASGKSIYLRQVALIVYMAHIGCFVPAAAARIGIHDQIITRIETRESVTRHSSAFMIDTEQMSHALRNSTAKSLIIIDEYGKGTETETGAGLFAATILNFLKRGKDCPKVVAATHFHELFERQCLPDSLPLRAVHMQILLFDDAVGEVMPIADPLNRGPSLKKITYLFRLQEGRAPSSHAMNVALMHGIPRTIVDRAVQIAECLAKGEEIEIQDTPQDSRKWAVCEELARQFVEWDLEQKSTEGSQDDGENIGVEDVKHLLDWFDQEISLIHAPDIALEEAEDEANEHISHEVQRDAPSPSPPSTEYPPTPDLMKTMSFEGNLDTEKPAHEVQEALTHGEGHSPDQQSPRSSTNFSAFEVTSLELREMDKVLEHRSAQRIQHAHNYDRKGKRKADNWQDL